jgi:hypothetical protein
LIDTLWADLGSGRALKRLQAAILRLRRRLDHDSAHGALSLRTVAGGFLHDVASGELDAEVCQTRIDAGRRSPSLHGHRDGDARRSKLTFVTRRHRDDGVTGFRVGGCLLIHPLASQHEPTVGDQRCP